MTNVAKIVLPRVVFSAANSGDLTVADARLALLGWLAARRAGGTMVIRLDDFVGGAEDGAIRLMRDLAWLGLDADEGPDREGAFGPYNQAARKEFYAHYAEKLLHEQGAFRCFCPAASSRTAQESAERCTSACERLEPKRVERLIRDGRPYVVRLRGQAGEMVVRDFVRGQITLRGETAGEPVLISAGGTPSAEFRAAVDDALMLITHLVRDEAAVPFTLKQLLICRALDLELPQVAHLPTLRPGLRPHDAAEMPHVTIDGLRREGYLPSTVLSFVAHLAGIENGESIVEKAEELLPLFDPERLNLEAPVFEVELLRAASRRQLALLGDGELRAALRPFLARAGLAEDDPRLPELVPLFKEWAVTMGDLAQKLSLFGRDPVPVMGRAAIKYLRRDSSQKVLWSLARQLRSLARLDEEVFTRLMASVRQETGIMGRDLWSPVRIALTGEADGPPLPRIVALLGKEAVVRLIERSVGEQA